MYTPGVRRWKKVENPWSKEPSQKYLEANEVKYFSLLPWPPPPSQKWNSVLLLASFYDGKHKHEANSFWKSEIVTMKSPTPSPLVKNISLHWLQGIFETVPKNVISIYPISRHISYISHMAPIFDLTLNLLEVSPISDQMKCTVIIRNVCYWYAKIQRRFHCKI